LKAVFIADLHIGSHYALANPDDVPRYAPGKKIHKRLFDLWRKCIDSPWHAPDFLVLDGDIIDGKGRRAGGAEQWTTDFITQAEAAIELIRMWKAKKIVVVRGTDYHVSPDYSGLYVEEWLARKIGAEEVSNQGHIPKERRDHSAWETTINVGGVVIHIAHAIGLSRVFHYMSTPIARAMLNAKLNAAILAEDERLKKKMKKIRPRIVIRAHAHYYWMCDTSNSTGIILPAWQARTPYMLKKGIIGYGPKIGFVGIECKEGEFRVEKKTWGVESVQRPNYLVFNDK